MTKERLITKIRDIYAEKGIYDREGILKSWTHAFQVENKLKKDMANLYQSNSGVVIADAYPEYFKPWDFPLQLRNYWTKDRAATFIRYTLEDVYGYKTKEEILNNFNVNFMKKNKLMTVIRTQFNNTLFDALDYTYPNRFSPWDLKKLPQGHLSKNSVSKKIRDCFEREGITTDEQILKAWSNKYLNSISKNKSYNMYRVFDNLWEALDYTYPNRFKKSQLTPESKVFNNADEAICYTQSLFKERSVTKEEVIESKGVPTRILGVSLKSIIDNMYNGNRQQIICEAFPEMKIESYLEEFEALNPPRPWTKEKFKKAMQYLVHKKYKLTDSDIKKNLSYTFIVKNGLEGPFDSLFNKNAVEAITYSLNYKYNFWELKCRAESYWNLQSAIDALRWAAKKNNIDKKTAGDHINKRFFFD